jgi:hypothetical protein
MYDFVAMGSQPFSAMLEFDIFENGTWEVSVYNN